MYQSESNLKKKVISEKQYLEKSLAVSSIQKDLICRANRVQIFSQRLPLILISTMRKCSGVAQHLSIVLSNRLDIDIEAQRLCTMLGSQIIRFR